jgi:hypothetical protein
MTIIIRFFTITAAVLAQRPQSQLHRQHGKISKMHPRKQRTKTLEKIIKNPHLKNNSRPRVAQRVPGS